MTAKIILEDNANAKNDSFLYYLRCKSEFNTDAFKKLCTAIHALTDEDVDISRTAQQINYVYGQTLKCFLFHVDNDDEYKITNLPKNYSKLLDILEKNVEYYFKTRI